MSEGGRRKRSVSLSLWEFCEEILDGGGLIYWGPRRICQVGLWKWASVSIGAPLLGNMGGRSFHRAFERREKISFFIRRTFIEDYKRHVKEGCGNGRLSS